MFNFYCSNNINPFTSPKCYFINDGTNIKRSHKGTPKHVGLLSDDYENALFNNCIKKAKFNRIIVDHRLGSATTKHTEKKCVNPIYLKMKVGTDMISVTPYTNEAGYL